MLTMEPVVQVNVSVDLLTTVQSVFDVGAIVGPSSVISTSTRFKSYGSLSAMVTDGFTSDMPEYVAAQKYFGVTPAPASVIIVHYDTDPAVEEYSSTKTYAVGDYCLHTADNVTKLYVCNTAIATAEEWTAAHWTEVPRTTDSPANALADAVEKGAEFYGVYACSNSSFMSYSDLSSIAGYLASRNFGVLFYGITGTATEITADGGILDSFNESATWRALGVTCTANASDAAGVMGVAMGMARTHTATSFALCYKSVASMTANNFTEDEVSSIKAMNGNVYVTRTKGRASLENGATASGLRYDEVLYLDMIKTDLQTACFNLIANSDIKLPQNDTTTALFKNVIGRVLEGYYGRNVLLPLHGAGFPLRRWRPGIRLSMGIMYGQIGLTTRPQKTALRGKQCP